MRARLLTFVFSLIFAGAFAGSAMYAYAQDEETAVPSSSEVTDETEAEQSAVDEGDPEAAALAEAQLKALNGQISSVSKKLDQSEISHFGIIYSNYTIYSVVKAVRNDVGQAVAACIKNNPAMEEQISKRWDEWERSVGANMKEAYANIEAMTLAQDYADKDQMYRIFDLVDATRAANSSRFEKIPATSPEACEFMLSKMDETQDNMNMMLIATIKSYSGIMKKMQE